MLYFSNKIKSGTKSNLEKFGPNEEFKRFYQGMKKEQLDHVINVSMFPVANIFKDTQAFFFFH